MSADLVPVEAHLADVLAAIRPTIPVRLGLEEAEGGVLVEDATARCPLPPFDNSAMDGYAVRAAGVAAAAPGPPVILPVTARVPAGDTRTHTLDPGTSARIMTGAPLPAGADAVVPVEWTDDGSERVAISEPAPVGHAIRRSGDDVAEGEVLVAAGTLLGPAQIGLLAAGGDGPALGRPRPPPAPRPGRRHRYRRRADRPGKPAGAWADLGLQQLHAGGGGASGGRACAPAPREGRPRRGDHRARGTRRLGRPADHQRRSQHGRR